MVSVVVVKTKLNINRLYDAYILDIDGTVCLGEELLPGAIETIQFIRQCGKRTLFLSNNTTKTCADFAHHLTELGLKTDSYDIINSTVVMIDFLKKRIPAARLHVIGEDALKKNLSEAGFSVTEDTAMVDAVITSFDRTFSYQKLQVAFDAIRNGAKFYATNSDRYRPLFNGGEPDAAAIIAAIEACTSVACEAIVGKPSIHIIDYVLSLLKISSKDCVVVGDRLETDIKMAINGQMSSALVLTGATSALMASQSAIQPTYVLKSIAELVPLHLKK